MYLKKKMMKQKHRRSEIGRRAWNILRLALLWARKGGVFKNRFMMDLRLLPKFITKSLRNSNNNHHRRGALQYGDRELSFDDTPVIHVRMHRPSSMRFKMPHIPCINPHVDFDYDFGCSDYDHDEDNINVNGGGGDDDVAARRSFLMVADHQQQSGSDNDCDFDECEETNIGTPSDEGIDSKAEEFIARFYQQMKLQRQISYLQYTEMISRGAN